MRAHAAVTGASLSDLEVQLTAALQPRSMRLGSRVSNMRREYCAKCVCQMSATDIAGLELRNGDQTSQRTHYHGELHRSPSPRETRVYPVRLVRPSCHHGSQLGGRRVCAAGQRPVCADRPRLCLYRNVGIPQRAHAHPDGDSEDQRRFPVCESAHEYPVYREARGQQQPAASRAAQLPAHKPFLPPDAPTPVHSRAAGSFLAIAVCIASSPAAVSVCIARAASAVPVRITGPSIAISVCDHATGSSAAPSRPLVLPASSHGQPLAAP